MNIVILIIIIMFNLYGASPGLNDALQCTFNKKRITLILHFTYILCNIYSLPKHDFFSNVFFFFFLCGENGLSYI